MDTKKTPQKEFIQVTVSLRPTDIKQLDEWANESHVPRSAVIRMLIQDRANKK